MKRVEQITLSVSCNSATAVQGRIKAYKSNGTLIADSGWETSESSSGTFKKLVAWTSLDTNSYAEGYSKVKATPHKGKNVI